MNVKVLIGFLIGLVIITGVLIYFQFTKPVSYSESNTQCQKLIYNGDPSTKINVLFLAKNINKVDIQSYVESFLSFSPFADYKDKFNFFYLDFIPSCEFYQGVALYCYSNDLIKKSSICPNDFIFVLSKETSNIRSSAYLNVISINTALPGSVLIHEFGHSFANLADEYIPAKIPYGSKNCQSNCDKFTGLGCFEGCSDASHFRSSENSVMKTLRTSKYEQFNENLVKQELEKY